MHPDSRTDDLWSAFVQDEINLVQDKLWLTLGVKFEKNDYTGYETQPNLRLFWKVADRHSFWASVARAVRTPSRAEDSGQITLANLPIPPAYPKITIDGNQDLKAEELIAYETGYRYFPSQSFSLDLALFYNDYKDIQSFQQLSFASPIFFANGLKGYAYGLELSTGWKPLSWLTTEANYSFIDIHLTETIPSIADSISVTAVAENSVPQHQISVRSGIKLSTHIDFNLWYRYVGTVKVASIQASTNNIKVNNYSTLDANLQWRINEAMTLTLAGQNLLDPYHLEFVGEVITPPVEIGRSIYAKLTWQF